jgi:cytosine/adenosine deaminase-related metal-dependent hydrolase
MAADIVAYRIDTPAFAGAQSDLAAALIFCHPGSVDYSIINGRVIVRDGALQTVELPRLVEAHNAAARRLMRGE